MRKRRNLVWKLALRLLEAKVSVATRYQLSSRERQEIQKILEEGDVLLDSNSAFPCSQLMAKIFFQTSWIHSGIYIGDGIVVDSGRKAHVARIKLVDFLRTTDLAIYRPNYSQPADREAAVQFAQKAVGKPFNITFGDSNRKRFYCTQLIGDALASMPHPIFLKRRNIFGKRVIPPASVAECSQMVCVWSSHPTILKSLRCHTPVLAGALTGGFAALILTGTNMWVGAVAGSLLTVHFMQDRTR